MRSTNIAWCPRLKVKEDLPSFEGRLFANVAIMQGRLEGMGDQMVPAAEVAKLLNIILEVGEVSTDDSMRVQ